MEDERQELVVRANGTVGRAPQRPNCGIGQSFEVRAESVSRLTIGSRLVVEQGIGLQWLVAERAQAWCQRCGTNLCGKAFGFARIHGTLCVGAQHPRIGMSHRSMDRMVNSSFSFFKRADGSGILLLTQKKCGSMAAQKARFG